jgi:hypothetical protein
MLIDTHLQLQEQQEQQQKQHFQLQDEMCEQKPWFRL